MINNSTCASFFRTPSANEDQPAMPIEVAATFGKRNKILKPEFEKFRCHFNRGPNTIRILPPLANSRKPWFIPFETYDFEGCPELIAPWSLGLCPRDNASAPPAEASIDIAKQDDPLEKFAKFIYTSAEFNHLGYRKTLKGSKEEKVLLRLWTAKRAILAFVAPEYDKLPPNTRALQLLWGSNSDGSRGGTTGLLHNIHALTLKKNQDGTSKNHGKLIYGAIHDTETGRNLTITVSGSGKGTKYEITPSDEKTPLIPIVENIVTIFPDLADTLKTMALEQTLYVPTRTELIGTIKGYCAAQETTAIKLGCETRGHNAAFEAWLKTQVQTSDAQQEPPSPITRL